MEDGIQLEWNCNWNSMTLLIGNLTDHGIFKGELSPVNLHI